MGPEPTLGRLYSPETTVLRAVPGTPTSICFSLTLSYPTHTHTGKVPAWMGATVTVGPRGTEHSTAVAFGLARPCHFGSHTAAFAVAHLSNPKPDGSS